MAKSLRDVHYIERSTPPGNCDGCRKHFRSLKQCSYQQWEFGPGGKMELIYASAILCAKCEDMIQMQKRWMY